MTIKIRFSLPFFLLLFAFCDLSAFGAGNSGNRSNDKNINKKLPSLERLSFDDNQSDSLKLALFSSVLNQTLSGKYYRSTRFGIHIQTEDGLTLYEKNSDKNFIPASTLKLVTTSVALNKLGPGFQYVTSISTDGEIVNNILEGNLVIHGTSDPKLSGFFDSEIDQIVKTWVDQLQALGINKINGNIFLDNSYYEDGSGKTKFAFQTVASFDKAAKSQLTQIVKGKNGKAVKQKIRLKKRTKRKLVTVRPNQYLANRFTEELNKRRMVSQKFPEDNFDIPDSAEFSVLIQHRSEPLAQIIKRTNKSSDNFYADQLVRTIGHEFGNGGTLNEGIAVISEFMVSEVGIPKNELKMSDGSGISHDNFLSAKSLTKILTFMSTDPNGPIYYESLSIPTVDGTLKNRIHHPLAENIRGKTGSISGVTSLTGYLTSNCGKKLVFSIICNGGRQKRLIHLEDQICKLLLNL